jgi:hypothetical protein
MSAFMLFASAMIATQVAALSLLVNDAIRRERSGDFPRAGQRARPRPERAPHGGVERRRARRDAGIAFERRAA